MPNEQQDGILNQIYGHLRSSIESLDRDVTTLYATSMSTIKDLGALDASAVRALSAQKDQLYKSIRTLEREQNDKIDRVNDRLTMLYIKVGSISGVVGLLATLGTLVAVEYLKTPK